MGSSKTLAFARIRKFAFSWNTRTDRSREAAEECSPGRKPWFKWGKHES